MAELWTLGLLPSRKAYFGQSLEHRRRGKADQDEAKCDSERGKARCPPDRSDPIDRGDGSGRIGLAKLLTVPLDAMAVTSPARFVQC